jgi:hypothetical protein
LTAAFAAYQQGNRANAVELSEAAFRDLTPVSAALALAEIDDSQREATIRYAAKTASDPDRLYVAEQHVNAGGWWDPTRWAYKAAQAEIDLAQNVLTLTFERDVSGLVALLLFDLIVSTVYGAVIGLILAVLGLEGVDGKHRPILPSPTPLPNFRKSEVFRA